MVKKIVKVLCLRDTSDERFLYQKDKVYDLPFDHPCMEYFEPVTYTTDPGDLGPAGVVLKKGDSEPPAITGVMNTAQKPQDVLDG